MRASGSAKDRESAPVRPAEGRKMRICEQIQIGNRDSTKFFLSQSRIRRVFEVK